MFMCVYNIRRGQHGLRASRQCSKPFNTLNPVRVYPPLTPPRFTCPSVRIIPLGYLTAGLELLIPVGSVEIVHCVRE